MGLVTSTPAGVILDTNLTLRMWLGREGDDLRAAPLSGLFDPGGRLFMETRHAQILHLQSHVQEVSLTMIGADGQRVAVLLSSTLTGHGANALVHTAVFRAAERLAYEKELLHARRAAEASESRVRALLDISDAFDGSASEQDVVDAFVRVARDAFVATDAAVLLCEPDGTGLRHAAGGVPLRATVLELSAVRDAETETVVNAARVREDDPAVAAQMRDARVHALSITPLRSDRDRLGVLVCFFARERSFDAHFFDLQRVLGRHAAQTLVRVRLQRRLERLAHFDQLTGVANRQHVDQSLQAAIDAAEGRGRAMGLIFIDVDDFKGVNDQHGHAVGDVVLRTLAERLESGVRTGDVVGRIGGDEFVVICPDADVADAQAIADRLLALVRAPVLLGGTSFEVSVSIGVAMHRPGQANPPTADQLLIRADDAMYNSKGDGKDRVSLERSLASAV